MLQEVDKETLHSSLKEHFGFDSFKGEQEKVIKSLLNDHDTFVIMPTGGGKSLCYQLPALLGKGTAIIVSPLIALMKNQVDQMRSYSSQSDVAHFLNSSLTKAQVKKVHKDIYEGRTKMLYVAPETLNKQSTIDFFKEVMVSFVAVDEAHCISEWGHDFRPEYRRIRIMIDAIAERVPVIALTATATPKVQSDILKNLTLDKPNIFLDSFNRPNLYYEVRPKMKKESGIREIIKFIKSHQGKSGIIYTLSRRSAEEVANVLNVNGIKAAAYHAGLDAVTRAQRQDQFLMEDADVIVATIAFGMGIDKPDVRFVIHYNFPKSLENYYQETGRAGRDGLEGICLSFYSYRDIARLEKLLRDKPVAEREMGTQLLNEAVAYAETPVCRRKFLLHYFGEEYPKNNCGNCDNCLNPKERFDGQEYVQTALEAIEEVQEEFDIQHISNILGGKRTQKVRDYEHEELKFYNTEEEKEPQFWISILRQAMLEGLIRKDIEQYGLLKLTDKGREYLKNPYPISIAINHDYAKLEAEQEQDTGKTGAVDPILLKMLKDLRRKVAKSKNLPPFVIFQDPSLEDMATLYPVTVEELNNITGVSKGKAIKYGRKFVELIADYVEENDIDRPDDFVMKSVANKSANKVYIIQNIDRKIPFEDIASSKGFTIEELLLEIESIVASGTKLNIDYYIEDIVDEEVQAIIYDYFMTASTDSIDAAYQELRDDGITSEEIQLVRIKFMSEMAN